MTGRAVEYRQQIAAHAPARTRLRPGQSQYGGIQVLMSYQRPADARPVVAFPGRHTWSAQKQRHTNALLVEEAFVPDAVIAQDRKSTRLNSSHVKISYAVFCLKQKI